MVTKIMSNQNMTPEEIREWEMKIGRFEGLNTEIVEYWVKIGNTTHQFAPDDLTGAEQFAKNRGGVVVPQTKDIIPRYHKSIEDLFRVLEKLRIHRVMVWGDERGFICEIGIDKGTFCKTPNEAIFNAIIRNITNVDTK